MVRQKSSWRAFTLIELLVVVAIIGILVAIAVPNYLAARIRARIAAVQGDFKTIVYAAELYQLDWGRYPMDGAYVENDTEEPNHGYISMTTPVAYLGDEETIRDPFARTSKRFSVGDDWDQFYEIGFSDALGGETNPTKKRDRYLIESVGPDGYDDIQGSRAYPLQPGYFTAYQPSNGLTSTGDIYWAGGVSIPSWLPAQQSP